MVILAEQQQSCHKRIGFSMIPLEDLEWAIEQKPAAMQLFLECWRSDPYGSRWMQLNTKLKPSAFREAKKQLAKQDLFIFKREVSIQDSRSTVCWLTRNLHGSRVKDFWKAVTPTELDATDTAINATDTAIDTAHMELDAMNTAAILPQTQSGQGIQSGSTSFQYLNSTSSSSISPEEELELEKKKEGECNQESTNIGIKSMPNSLATLEEKPEKIENAECLDQGECSAAPPKTENRSQSTEDTELLKWVIDVKLPALNLKDPARNPEAYAKAMVNRDGDALRKEFAEVVAERDFYARAAELTTQVRLRAGEWEALGLKVMVYDDLSGMPMVMLDGDTIAAVDFLSKPIEQPMKLIPELSNPDNMQNRSYRLKRLRCAKRVGQYPGADFLADCWGDIALQSEVKALIAKYPQWGISIESLGSPSAGKQSQP